MSTNEYIKLLEESSRIRQTIKEQQERLKKIEEQLISLSGPVTKTGEYSNVPLKQRGERPEERLAPPVKQRRSWLVLFEMYNGHYTLQFLGTILFFVGILFTVNHAIKAGTMSPVIGIYGCLAASGIAALIGAFLSKRKSEGGSVAFEGALVLAYGSLVIGFKDYALFSSTTTFLSLIGLAAVSLFLAYEKNSQLLALLGIVFAECSFLVEYSTGLLPSIKFLGSFGVTIGALLLALKKRWSYATLVSYAFWSFIMLVSPFSFKFIEPWHCLVFFVSFALIPLLYAFFAKTDSYLESVLIAVVLFWSPAKRLFYWFASLFLSPLAISRIPFYLVESAINWLIGAFSLLALFVFYKRKDDFFPLPATLYGLFYIFYTGSLLSLGDSAILSIYYCACLCAIVGFLKRSILLYKIALVLGIYSGAALIFHPSSSLTGLQGWGVLLVSVFALLVTSFGIGRLLPDNITHGSLSFKDIVYGSGLLSVLFAWVVLMHYEIGAPYMGLFPALYALIILQALPFDRQRVITASIGIASFGLTALYALIKYIFVYNKHLFPYFFPEVQSFFQTPSGLSLFVILKQATILLGVTALVGFFLYVGMERRKKSVMQSFYIRAQPFIGGVALLALFLLLRLYLIAGIRFGAMVSDMKNIVSSFFHFSSSAAPALTGSLALYENSILKAYYALTGLALVAAGSAYKKPLLRLTGIMLLFAVVGWVLSRLGISSQGFAEQFVLLAIGVIVLGASFFYRRSKR